MLRIIPTLLFLAVVCLCVPTAAQTEASPRTAETVDTAHIIAEFTAGEDEFLAALRKYGYRTDIVVQSVSNGKATGEYRRSTRIVLKDGKPILVTGSPGGSRIISTVLQVIVNVLDYGMDVAAAVGAPRLHHQWLPDEVRLEAGFTEETLAGLRAKGHRLVQPMGQTSANSIAVTDDELLGAPDPRTRGAAAVGE